MRRRPSRLIYVLDQAAAGVLEQRGAGEAGGCTIVDHRGEPYRHVADLAFTRDPETGLLG